MDSLREDFGQFEESAHPSDEDIIQHLMENTSDTGYLKMLVEESKRGNPSLDEVANLISEIQAPIIRGTRLKSRRNNNNNREKELQLATAGRKSSKRNSKKKDEDKTEEKKSEQKCTYCENTGHEEGKCYKKMEDEGKPTPEWWKKLNTKNKKVEAANASAEVILVDVGYLLCEEEEKQGGVPCMLEYNIRQQRERC